MQTQWTVAWIHLIAKIVFVVNSDPAGVFDKHCLLTLFSFVSYLSLLYTYTVPTAMLMFFITVHINVP